MWAATSAHLRECICCVGDEEACLADSTVANDYALDVLHHRHGYSRTRRSAARIRDAFCLTGAALLFNTTRLMSVTTRFTWTKVWPLLRVLCNTTHRSTRPSTSVVQARRLADFCRRNIFCSRRRHIPGRDSRRDGRILGSDLGGRFESEVLLITMRISQT